MPREILYKDTVEVLNPTMDFTADVPAGGSLSSVAATAVDSSGTSATTALLGTATKVGAVATIPLKATSTDKETYVVTVKATMSDSSIVQRILEVRIRNNDTVE